MRYVVGPVVGGFHLCDHIIAIMSMCERADNNIYVHFILRSMIIMIMFSIYIALLSKLKALVGSHYNAHIYQSGVSKSN